MPMTVEQLVAEAKALPLDARCDLIDGIVDSIGPARPQLDDDAQRELIRRRVEEVRTGKVQTIAGEQVFAELDAMFPK